MQHLLLLLFLTITTSHVKVQAAPTHQNLDVLTDVHSPLDAEQSNAVLSTVSQIQQDSLPFLHPTSTWSHIDFADNAEVNKDTTTRYRMAPEATDLDAIYGSGPYYSLQYAKSIPTDAMFKDAGIFFWDDAGVIRYAVPDPDEFNETTAEELLLPFRLIRDTGVLYDFNLTVGDTFQPPTMFDFGASNAPDELLVSSIDTVLLENGEARRQWSFDLLVGGQNFGPWSEWIGGIGDETSFFGPAFAGVLDGGGPLLQCFQSDEEILLSRGDRCDRTTSIAHPALNAISPLLLYPNPSTGVVRFESVENAESVYVYNSLGRLVHAAPTVERTLHLDHLPAGVYSVVVVDGEGVARVGRLVLGGLRDTLLLYNYNPTTNVHAIIIHVFSSPFLVS
ncbi:T9SS type A sorting domain-containing protein [Lewinella sp. 4G2]|uniref:T9SS type A sorting domain-containing protein n=1 Tax=Lewinella sp. 4G2 TaxID=1803372 RepID=UPI0007E1E68B|nr:T9SS type A sorting domain-containing protein [Lewinella sp. 4G2]OAV43583.1 hypothetical protein A3850_003320 [Lewinella sp. 4G2]